MDHYNKGDGIKNPWLDKDMQPLALTEPEIDDVVAFLASLTSPQYKEAWRPGVCAATRSIQGEPPPAGHRTGIRPKAEAAAASSPLIAQRDAGTLGIKSEPRRKRCSSRASSIECTRSPPRRRCCADPRERPLADLFTPRLTASARRAPGGAHWRARFRRTRSGS